MKYAHFDAAGQFLHFIDADTPPAVSPDAAGHPRTVPMPPSPAYDAATQTIQFQGDWQSPGWVVLNNVFDRTVLRNRIAERRWEEQQGTAFDVILPRTPPPAIVVPLKCDLNTQVNLTGLVVTQRGAAWKGSDGVFRDISFSDVLVLAEAFASRLEACFARERVLTAQLAALSDDQLVSLVGAIEQFWPTE